MASDLIRGWFEGWVWFAVVIAAVGAVAALAGVVAWGFTQHPVASSLLVLGGIVLLGVRYGGVVVWKWAEVLLVVMLCVCGLLGVGLLSPHLLVTAGLGLIAWGLFRWKRRRND